MVTAGNIVTSDLTFVPKPSDNQAVIKCTASNEATTVPLETSVVVTVYCKYSQLSFVPNPQDNQEI